MSPTDPLLIARLAPAERASYYERVAFELTLVARDVWSDASLTHADKVERLKAINELQHKLIQKMSHLREGSDARPDVEFLQALLDHDPGQPDLSRAVRSAVRESMRRA